MTEIPQPTSLNDRRDLTYDAWNRLVKIKDGMTTVAEYEYDGLNRRIVKIANSETRHFYYNASQVLEERVGTSTNAAIQYIWGTRYIDDLILRDRNADNNSGTGSFGFASSGLEERLYALQDANWNVVALTDENGAVKQRFQYDPYGSLTKLDPDFTPYTGTDHDWEYTYTSRRLDDETGLMHYRNRYYHPELGRFLTRDPIGYWGGLNLYQYVGGTPLIANDPSGFARISIDADAFIPDDWVSIPPTLSKIFSRFGYYSYVKGNNRKLSDTPVRSETKTKVFNWIEVETCSCGTEVEPKIGRGAGLDSSTRKDHTPALRRTVYTTDTGTLTSTETAVAKCTSYKGTEGCCRTAIRLTAVGQSPISITNLPAAINYDYSIILYHCGTKVHYEVEGTHDGYPAHEFYLSHGNKVFDKNLWSPPKGVGWFSGASRLLGFYDTQSVALTGSITAKDKCCCTKAEKPAEKVTKPVEPNVRGFLLQ